MGVPELKPPDCTASKPATNWNSTMLDGVMRDFMNAVCGAGTGLKGSGCKKSVVQQLSTMPSWLYEGGYPANKLPEYPWDTPNPFNVYTACDSLVDKSCKQ